MSRNPIARVVTRIKPKVVQDKREKLMTKIVKQMTEAAISTPPRKWFTLDGSDEQRGQ